MTQNKEKGPFLETIAEAFDLRYQGICCIPDGRTTKMWVMLNSDNKENQNDY